VFFAGVAAASALLPAGSRGLASRLALLAGPAEALVVAVLAHRAFRIARALRAGGADVPVEDALASAAREVLGPYRFVEVLTSELTVLGFAALSWRSAPYAPRGAEAFTVHRRSGAGALVFALSLAGAGEAIGAHLLLARWSAAAAWTATALSLYGLAWLAGDWRALALRPVLLHPRELEVRIGLRWRATVPLAAVTRVCRGPDPRNHPGALRASPLGPPLLYLHLAAPVELRGPFGMRRRGDCVGLRVDDAEGLARAVEARIGA
jgi:hypothetical protein